MKSNKLKYPLIKKSLSFLFIFFVFLNPSIKSYATIIENDKIDINRNVLAVSFTTNPSEVGGAITICQGQTITYTDTSTDVGTNPNYSWTFQGGSSTSSAVAGPHTITYNTAGNYTTTLTINGVSSSVDVVVLNLNSTIPIIDVVPDIGWVTTNFNNTSYFNYCADGNAGGLFLFSTSSTNTNDNTQHIIDWGDGSANTIFSGTNIVDEFHPYTSNGIYQITYTVILESGCSSTKIYNVFLGANPTATIINYGVPVLCIPGTVQFTIIPGPQNTAGTIYTFEVNDNSPPQTFTHSEITSPGFFVTHNFNAISCGTSSNINQTIYPNSFQASVTVTNPCGSSSSAIGPINIQSKPIAGITANPSNNQVCINSSVIFTDSTTPGTNIGSSPSFTCTENYKRYWQIDGPSGLLTAGASGVINPNPFITVVGNLGFNGTFPNNPSVWTQTATNTLNITFNTVGTYSITLFTSGNNSCGITSETRTICVNPELIADFTLNPPTGCASTTIQIENLSSLPGCNNDTIFNWQVSHTNPENCPNNSIPGWSFSSGNASSSEPEITFTSAGVYTIQLTTSLQNAVAGTLCQPDVKTQTLTIKDKPVTTLTPQTICQGDALTLNPIVFNCYASQAVSYLWDFSSNPPLSISSTTAANPTITFDSVGTYNYTLTLTNECGSNTFSSSIIVNPAVQMTASGPSATCFNTNIPLIGTISDGTAAINWTASITGGTFSPNETSISPTYTPPNNFTGTITFTLTYSNPSDPCPVEEISFQVIVNEQAIVEAGSYNPICQNGSVQLNAIVGGAASTGSWSSSNGGLFSDPNSLTSNYTPPVGFLGTIILTLTTNDPPGPCNAETDSVIITVIPSHIISTQPTATQSVCVGGTIEPLTVAYTGGEGTATYQWFSNTTNNNSDGTLITGATNSSYTPAAFTSAGTFYLYATVTLSGNGCGSITSNTAEVVIVADPIVDTQALATQSICQSSIPTDLTITVSGGIGTFAYQWYSNTTNSTSGGTPIASATNATFTPLTTTLGTQYYYCVVTQSGTGCNVMSAVSTVIIVPEPAATIQPTFNSVCENGTPTLLTVAYTNGTGTPTYQWFNNTTNSTIGGTVIAGATTSSYSPPATIVGTLYYYCEITFSSGGCTSVLSNTAEVLINPLPTISTQPTASQSICVGGTILNPLSFTFTGGTGTPSYHWYSNTISSNTGGTLIPGATEESYTPPVFDTPGSYYYYVIINFSASGCAAITSDVAEINIISNPIVLSQPIPSQTLCQNAIVNVLTVIASGGVGSTYNYQWYVSSTNSTTAGSAIVGETNDSYTPPTDIAGTLYYYCIITQPNDSGCEVTSEVAEINSNLSPAIDSQPLSNTICLGQTMPALTFSFINGIGTPFYQWYSNTVNSNIGGTAIEGATNDSYSPPVLLAGVFYYYCEVTFPTLSGGCEIIMTDVVEISIDQVPVISPETTTICSGSTFTVIPINSGGNIIPIGTTYVWSDPVINPLGSITGGSQQNIPQSEISQELVNTTSIVATATYTVIPSSGFCQGDAITVTVTVNPSINPNITVTNSTCFGINNASIVTNITGGIPFSIGAPYLITWLGPNGFTSTATSITNLEPGIYTLTVEDAGGCPFSDTYTITEPDEIVIIIDSENDISCFNSANGSIDLTITGGTEPYIYTWTFDGNPFENTEDIADLSPGTYVVSITDANNCGPKTASFTITQPPLLDVDLVNQVNVECFGDATGAITISVVGGTPIEISTGIFDYSYFWEGPNGFTSTDQNLLNITGGTYNLTVTDNNGCTDTLTIVITQAPEIIITYTTTPISCYGANDASLAVTLSGGVPGYQFTWNNLSTSLNQNNLSAGNYSITVTDALGCVRIETINIPEAPVFMVNPIVSNVSCFGANDGSINLNLTGGISPFTLTWSDGSTAGLIRNNLSPGTYTATISDGTPCYIVRTFIIIEPHALVLSANLTNPLDCDNANTGAINLIVAGGTPPYNYLWSNGATTEDLNGLTSGNYVVTVTDANGCSNTGQYALTRPNPLEVNVNTETDADCDTREVTQYFVAQASGGVPPYNYEWSSGTVSGVNNEIMQTDENGMVILTVTDALGCAISYNANVDNLVIGDPSIATESFGFLTYGIYSVNDPIQFYSNATADYLNIIWDFGDGTFSNEENPVHTYLLEKEYIVTLTVTYPFGCIYVMTVSILVEKGYLLVIPTAFTPNSDGLNDTFLPISKRLKNIRMDVYDSWGSLIYSETGDSLKGWNGKIKDVNAENGNYYIVITAETFYGLIIQDKQTFVLLK